MYSIAGWRRPQAVLYSVRDPSTYWTASEEHTQSHKANLQQPYYSESQTSSNLSHNEHYLSKELASHLSAQSQPNSHNPHCKSVCCVVGSTKVLLNWHETQFWNVMATMLEPKSESAQAMSAPLVLPRTLPHTGAHGEVVRACSAEERVGRWVMRASWRRVVGRIVEESCCSCCQVVKEV